MAAGWLGLTEPAVRGRLARARERLRSRLTRRGVTIPAALSTAVKIPGTASAAITPALVETTVLLAMNGMASNGAPTGFVSASVAALTRGVLRSMLMNKLKVAAAAVLAVGLAASGMGVLYHVGATTGDAPPNAHSVRNKMTSLLGKRDDPRDGAAGPKDQPQARMPQLVAVDSDSVLTVAFAPDGKTIATGGMDGTVKLWDAVTGDRRATLKVPKGSYVRSVAFSPGGETVASVGDDGFVRLWDAATGEMGRTLPALSEAMHTVAPSASVPSVIFSPDGKRLATGGGGGTDPATAVYQVRLFDIGAGQLIWEHIGRGEWTLSMAYSPDGKGLAWAGSMTAKSWDTETGDLKRILKPERGGVSAVSFSSDGRLLAGGGACRKDRRDGGPVGQVSIWAAETGEQLRALDGSTGGARAVAFAPSGYSVACGGYGRVQVTPSGGSRVLSEVRLWDAASGERRWTWEGEHGDLDSLAFSPDGKTLVVCDDDMVGLIDVGSGKTKRTLMKTTWKSR